MREIQRRGFLKGITAAVAGNLLAGDMPSSAAETARIQVQKSDRVVGVHIAAHSFYDEGFDRCLDFLQETAGVNTLLVTSNSYYGAILRPKEVQGDHGVPIRDGRDRRVTRTWFRPHEQYYARTSLRHRGSEAGAEYAGREIFADLAQPARRRGMKVHERMYEPGAEAFRNWISGGEQVLAVDVCGQPGDKPCWNNPQYLEFVAASVTDLFASYPLDGIQYGAERNGPLSRLIDWPQAVPTCFCNYCRAQAAAEGVDFELARKALGEMNAFIASLKKGQPAGPDGPLVEFMRLLLRYPVILEWEAMHYRAGERLHRRIYDSVKAANPVAMVGRHIDHSQGSWDLLFRAAMPYARMAECNDYLKISTYHEIFGPRLETAVRRYAGHIARQVPPDDLLNVFYAIAGHDKTIEPKFDELAAGRLSSEYVYRETRRAVEGVAGKAAIYAGIAIDVPTGTGWGSVPRPSDPAVLECAVRRAFDAGAEGLVICREYEEMREDSLRAVGKTLKQLSG